MQMSVVKCILHTEHTLNKKLNAEVLRRIFSLYLWIGFILQKCKDGRYILYYAKLYSDNIWKGGLWMDSILTLFSINIISVNIITMAKE